VAVAHNGEIELYVETFGSPDDPTLLLVNGLGSQCISYRLELCQAFVDAGFHVVRYDNRDVGLSTKVPEPAPHYGEILEALAAGRRPEVPYLLSDLADDGLAVLDELGVERAHVFGASMGGMIVQTMAIEHPERFLTMTSMMSTTGERDVGAPTPEALALLTGPPPLSRQDAVEAQLAASRTWGSPDHLDEARLSDQALEAYDRCFDPAGTARQFAAILASGSRADGLRRLTVPTLVLHGDRDNLVDVSGGRRTAELVPGARLEILEGMGHDYPPAYWPTIVSLVAAHAGVSRP
jgi:pimeloyl-ACP methyl ester carboxylesterase